VTDTRRSGRRGAQALWSCPLCGVKLVTRNSSHSCGPFSVEAFLRGKSDAGRDLFRRFVAVVERCGPCSLAPAKTRVAFVAQVRFASVNRVGGNYIDVHFVLPRVIDSPRFSKVDHFGKLYVHHLRLRGPREFDRQLTHWLGQSYAEYGRREWLKDKPSRR